MDYVWYVGYGSNLHKQRFLCYVAGGIPRFGHNRNKGCTDTTPPGETRPLTINYPLYFALPDGIATTSNWGKGGVAFIAPQEDRSAKTLCRMWKITKAQYACVKEQEGPWYRKEIRLGKHDGIPACTITNDAVLPNKIHPSDAYIRTIALGLAETYGLRSEEIVDYLLDKTGIRDQRDELLKTVTCL